MIHFIDGLTDKVYDVNSLHHFKCNEMIDGDLKHRIIASIKPTRLAAYQDIARTSFIVSRNNAN